MALTPLHVFRFLVSFQSQAVLSGATFGDAQICEGAFAECSGLEATMEPKAIKEGGRNYGITQRAGQISFNTVVLKRGVSSNRNLWQVFNAVSSGLYAARLQVTINMLDIDRTPIIAWQLDRAMPIKFKFADLNARSAEVGIEELHLVHEGLSSVSVN
jgi:phage tail-like protein